MDNIKALGIEKYFETILISEWEGIKKPDPQIFKRALDQMKVSANESLFVGDHPENDVKASQNIGMKGIWMKDSQQGNFETKYIIDDLAELPHIIDRVSNESIESC
jgi:putative hydrolase of the HAD superfamily